MAGLLFTAALRVSDSPARSVLKFFAPNMFDVKGLRVLRSKIKDQARFGLAKCF